MTRRWLGRYILDAEKRPVECDDLMQWARWFERNRQFRQLARDEIVVDGVEYLVSTVFLGVDHSWDDKGPPILFETMIFRLKSPEEKLDSQFETEDTGDMWRYASWDDAEAGHKCAVARLKAGVIKVE